MKNIILVSLFFVIGLSAKSQIVMEANVGYGFYDLKDIKTLQSDMMSSVYLPNLKSVETFPNHLIYSFSGNYFVNHNNRIGLEFSYLTTGGRNHLVDYSGEYKLDMILNGYRMGIQYQNFIISDDKLSVGLQCTSGIIASRLKINEDLVIYDEEIMQDQLEMKGTGMFVEPSLNISYAVTNNVCFNIKGGYEYDFKSRFRLDDEKTKILANWYGIRLSLGVVYCIN